MDRRSEQKSYPISSRQDVYVFFFFQAEDGIRDLTVTGVQTCALPIFILALTSTNKASARMIGRMLRVLVPTVLKLEKRSVLTIIKLNSPTNSISSPA